MKHLLFIAFFLGQIFNSIAHGQQWVADTLVHGYLTHTVIQPDDYQGHVVSTIIKHEHSVTRHRAILYIHGYNDYFFQGQLGDSIVAHDWNFMAVDLRRYGRSLRQSMNRYEVRNLNEYFPDIDSAVVMLNKQGIDTIVIMAHSTGGLIASLYMNQQPPATVKGLILNSPFLDWNMNGFTRKVLIPIVSCIGRMFPNIKISQGHDSSYAHSLLSSYNGEWNYDTNLKLTQSPPVTSGWIRAINTAQHFVQRHSDIKVPILLMHSSASVAGGDNASKGDAVLNVQHIIHYGNLLGPDVTDVTIQNGLHDLILSNRTARDSAYHAIFHWLTVNFPADEP